METYAQAMRIALANRENRRFPDRDDARCDGNNLFPHVTPKFRLDFSAGAQVFTIGSCFARNIEKAFSPLGVRLPTRAFTAEGETAGPAYNLLNEYNPGTIARRILDALGGIRSSATTLVASRDGIADLLLPGARDVTMERALQRREAIFEIYTNLPGSSVVIITLGLAECWYDGSAKQYLNRLPPAGVAKADPGRFTRHQLNARDVVALLEEPLKALGERGSNIVLTVSPVPMLSTLTRLDAVSANEFSKATLLVAAQHFAETMNHVDYFPSYEIVRSGGLSNYESDNVHVRDPLVRRITARMVEVYSAATDSRASTLVQGAPEK